jgi:hypothetical protein
MTKGFIKKLIKFIKIKVLTKELEFRAPKIKKNMKTTKNGAPGASQSNYNDKTNFRVSALPGQPSALNRTRAYTFHF